MVLEVRADVVVGACVTLVRAEVMVDTLVRTVEMVDRLVRAEEIVDRLGLAMVERLGAAEV